MAPLYGIKKNFMLRYVRWEIWFFHSTGEAFLTYGVMMKVYQALCLMVALAGVGGDLYAASGGGKVTVTAEGSGAVSDLASVPVTAVKGLVGAANILAGAPASISNDISGTARYAIDSAVALPTTAYQDIKTGARNVSANVQAGITGAVPSVKYTPGKLTPPAYTPGSLSIQ
jgi:hypothetical protein